MWFQEVSQQNKRQEIADMVNQRQHFYYTSDVHFTISKIEFYRKHVVKSIIGGKFVGLKKNLSQLFISCQKQKRTECHCVIFISTSCRSFVERNRKRAVWRMDKLSHPRGWRGIPPSQPFFAHVWHQCGTAMKTRDYNPIYTFYLLKKSTYWQW